MMRVFGYKIDFASFFSSKKLIAHYFFLYCIGILLARLTGKAYIISLLIPLLLLYLGIFRSKRYSSINSMDTIWNIMLFWMVSTWIFNDYPFKTNLIWRCLIGQFAYMMAYWIGRDKRCRVFLHKMFENAIYPLLVCCILGIWWFFSPPLWYVQEIADAVQNGAQQSVDELSRLKSFFTSPYDLSYFGALMCIYLFHHCVLDNRVKKINYILIVFVVTCLIFGMMRATLIAAVLGLFSAYFCLAIRKRNASYVFFPIAIFVALFSVFLFAVQYLDPHIMDFITYKFSAVSDNSSGFITERFNMYGADMLLWGDGTGRHAFYADDYVKGTRMVDGDYIKIIVEQGLIGFSLYIILFGLAIIKCLRNFRHLSMEFCMVVFCAFSMIGANTLSTSDKHCFIFWMVLGIISAYHKPKKRKIVPILAGNSLKRRNKST